MRRERGRDLIGREGGGRGEGKGAFLFCPLILFVTSQQDFLLIHLSRTYELGFHCWRVLLDFLYMLLSACWVIQVVSMLGFSGCQRGGLCWRMLLDFLNLLLSACWVFQVVSVEGMLLDFLNLLLSACWVFQVVSVEGMLLDFLNLLLSTCWVFHVVSVLGFSCCQCVAFFRLSVCCFFRLSACRVLKSSQYVGFIMLSARWVFQVIRVMAQSGQHYCFCFSLPLF